MAITDPHTAKNDRVAELVRQLCVLFDDGESKSAIVEALGVYLAALLVLEPTESRRDVLEAFTELVLATTDSYGPDQ